MIYAVDFDGYLCENKWPEIGQPHTEIIEHFKALRAQGHKLILNTCREGELLHNAIAWCASHGLVFDAHNENLPERIAEYGGDCRKISADYYCDDRNYWLMPGGVHNGRYDRRNSEHSTWTAWKLCGEFQIRRCIKQGGTMKYSFRDINGAVQTVDYENVGNKAFNVDCMVALKETPDKFYELCICDPPYGIGEDGGRFRDRKGGGHRVLPKKSWDNERPPIEYFHELQRVSQNQIVWGGNYFADRLPVSRCWLYWQKLMGGDFSDGELAWTSFDKVVKEFTYCNKYHGKIHPTQKPVALYEWLLTNYAKPGDRILDTHLGSGSSRIAAYNLGFDFVGYEIDKDYFEAQEKRFEAHISQTNIFELTPEESIEQIDLLEVQNG